MSYQAKTNKDTKVATLDENVPVKSGTTITVEFERGKFGSITVTIGGEEKFGVMLKADYTAV
jgi:hypothetical protein